MSRPSHKKPPRPPLQPLPGLPTQPGWYWWSNDLASRGIMVEVNVSDGRLVLHLSFRDDVPVADATGYWRVRSHPPLDQAARLLPNLAMYALTPFGPCTVVRVPPTIILAAQWTPHISSTTPTSSASLLSQS